MSMHYSPIDRTIGFAASSTRRIPVVIFLGVLLLSQFGSEARANSRGPAWFTDPIVGTWEVVVDITNCATGAVVIPGSKALALFNADGTRHETAASNPALRTPAYGHWERVGKNEYEFAFKFFRFEASGATVGSTTVRHDLFLTDEDVYYSEGTAEFHDPAGNLLFVACAVAAATRFE